MMQVLLAIFRDKELSVQLAFKGGTSLMLFHKLPRFSTDLDFNLLDDTKAESVFHALHNLLLRFGKIDDEAMKFYGPLLVLNYGGGNRMLKIEVSTRQYDNHYEIKTLAGTDVRVMITSDMFAHKLCALGERITPRDIFDVWFFLQKSTAINPNIVRLRTGMSVADYAAQCAESVRKTSPKVLMQGIGELIGDEKQKTFVRSRLIEEAASNLELFALSPIISDQTMTERMRLLTDYPAISEMMSANDVDLSIVSERQLRLLVEERATLVFPTRSGDKVSLSLVE
ncbi:MAG: nucleotidyl transferase AbiEii/AbiGii toxin family protein [Bacteroidales bacterium]|nr:nucleotidyl transferase AbiEii/AbiGii toxin family protein [Bacteroidales bacterium]